MSLPTLKISKRK